MMSLESQSEIRASAFPFLRRKRAIFVLVASLITVYLFLRTSSSGDQFTDLHGLLYMVSATENVLPPNLDVNAPVPPSTWVPPETFSPDLWRRRIERLDVDTPLIVFSKTYCPFSRRAKDLLIRYAMEPAPHVVEVDLRDDGAVIKGLLSRLTGRATFPNIILQGRSLGGYDDLQDLHEKGDLERQLKKAGIRVTGNIHEN